MKQEPETNRTAAGGEVTEAMIRERATEIARAEDRDDAGASDLEEAREELMGGSDEPEVEELIPEDARIGDGSPPGETGHRAARSELDDESSAAEQEIEEGLADADLDSREESHRHR
ncbi:MAG TPA: hypothetical protein VIM61_01835 [Chthoniobacterales bacterium]